MDLARLVSGAPSNRVLLDFDCFSEVALMKRWTTVSVVLFLGLFWSGLISPTQDVDLYVRNQVSELSLQDYVAPRYTASFGSAFEKPSPAQAALIQSVTSPRDIQVPNGLKVMVFSPHPDDETLGAGGLMQRVLENNGTVRVVFMTNGDGYKEALTGQRRSVEPSSEDFIEYGRTRQEEARLALCQLGLSPEDALFLGFPDGGIDDLWTSYWSRQTPYTSPTTRADRPPYEESFSRWSKYAGSDLEAAIRRALRDFTPDWVVIPDPRDEHPDHACTGVFVMDSLRKLNQSGDLPFQNTQVLTYLVHFAGYPASQKWLRNIKNAGIAGSLAGARILSQTRWVSLPLTSGELSGKARALTAHQSQFGMLGWFFRIYVRHREVYGRLEPVQILAVPQEYAAHFNRPST